MDKDFEIEIQDENVDEAPSVQLPMNFLTFGEIENDDVKVYIKQDVYKALEKLAASDTTKELGSIILGEYCQEHGKTHVIISQYIEAKYTDASASTLTFTHETWDYVHAEHEKRYPDKKIIGWQHTHPNYGIFLSNYDMFIQENFFNLPFQVAYVIDPIQNLRGFFQWKNGRIEKLKGYYIYDDVGKPIKIEQTKVKKEKPAPAKTSKAASILIALLCIATLFLSFFAISLNNKYEKQLEKQEEILADISSQQEEIKNQKDEIEGQKTEIGKQNEVIQNQADAIAKLQELLANGVLDSTGQTTAADLLEMLENHELTLQNQDELIGELKALLEKQPEENVVAFKAYTVVAGDSLSKICAANNLDYASNYKIILAINGIKDANQIYVGQTILLPVGADTN
ncbi:MAG: LysM peptidoglycan-binding domain-containing protein [Ruminococcaceae bacterium]|nr:LysM peptidoglycan-binding domain-containing protein [Oscillospiraceae bacterium]